MPAYQPSPQELEIARELFPGQPDGFPFAGAFESSRVRLPADDDMGIDSSDEAMEEVQTETGFGSVIVVTGLPVVPQEKHEKLTAVVTKVLSQWGPVREVFMPKDTNGTSKGYAFAEYDLNEAAQLARQASLVQEVPNQQPAHPCRLDRNHRLVINLFDDIDKYAKVPDNYVAPEPKEFKPQEDMFNWMLDKLGRDQFVLRAGAEVLVAWNDGKRGRLDEVAKRNNWTETFVQWSPMGTYMTTLHRQGAAIWGGRDMGRLNKYEHQGVRLLEFSPNEHYLVTYSSQEPTRPTDHATVSFLVHDVRTGRKLRVFEGTAEEYSIGSSAGAIKWPVFKWAGGKEDKFCARMGRVRTADNQAAAAILVYQAPEMKLLDGRPLKMDGVQDFEFSPSDPILAAYTAEQNQMPARIALVKLPERTEVRQKNLFSVSDVRIFWHPQGDYLAVKVDRYTKTKKSTYTGFEIFSIRDKDIPMEVMELPNKGDKVVGFAWEPKGHRFAVLHGDTPKPNISFYSMRDEKGRLQVKHLNTLPQKSCTNIYWSPQGRHLVLAGLKNFNGQLEFFNVDEMEVMAAAEHFMATDVEWDPTGRYIATSVTSVHQMENGFNIWSFQGKLLYVTAKERLFQFSWRPRLPSLLSAEKEVEIVKNLKAYSKKYDEEDEQLLLQADADVLQERQRMLDEWTSYTTRRAEYVQLVDGFRRTMYGERFAEGAFKMETTTVEQVVDIKEEPYKA